MAVWEFVVLKNNIQFSYLSGPCKPVTRLTHADVQAEFLDPHLLHRVLGRVLGHGDRFVSI